MGTNGFSQAIHALLRRIRDRRDEIEQARQLPDDVVEALVETRVFTLGVPHALGGEEADPLDAMRAIEMISAADGSTGWCVMLGIGAGMVAGQMPEAGAREVFAKPAWPKALVADPAGAAVRDGGDGLVVSGRWRFASGVTHADWIVVGCVVVRDGQPVMTEHGPEIVHVFLPKSDVEVHDTWHVSGLRGTGSHDVSCDGVRVPAERVLSLFQPIPSQPGPLYRLPPLSIVAPPISVVALGIARAALDELYELAGGKTPTLSAVPLAAKPATEIEIARAEGALSAGRALLYEVLDELWQTVSAGDEPSMRLRALCRIAANQATETAASVARLASTHAGGTSVYNGSSLQRHARDADVITHHFTQAPHVWEDAGRVLMGLPPTAPLF